MPLASTTVNVFPIHQDQAEAAAQGVRNLIGDRPEPWSVSIYTPTKLGRVVTVAVVVELSLGVHSLPVKAYPEVDPPARRLPHGRFHLLYRRLLKDTKLTHRVEEISHLWDIV